MEFAAAHRDICVGMLRLSGLHERAFARVARFVRDELSIVWSRGARSEVTAPAKELRCGRGSTVLRVCGRMSLLFAKQPRRSLKRRIQ